MIRDILDANFVNLEGRLPSEERQVAELLVYRILEILRDYKTMTPLRVEYMIRFSEYQRKRAVLTYNTGGSDPYRAPSGVVVHRDDEEHLPPSNYFGR